jgi:hypothetical protein
MVAPALEPLNEVAVIWVQSCGAPCAAPKAIILLGLYLMFTAIVVAGAFAFRQMP